MNGILGFLIAFSLHFISEAVPHENDISCVAEAIEVNQQAVCSLLPQNTVSTTKVNQEAPAPLWLSQNIKLS